MNGKKPNSRRREKRRSLSGRILRSAIFNILVLVVVSCAIMSGALQSLANNILLDSLQPMARQSAKTVEANIHMLADRMMTIAGDPRMHERISGGMGQTGGGLNMVRSQEVLDEAAEIYELYSIALYGLDGKLIQGIQGSPAYLSGDFFHLLRETDNLTTDTSTRYLDHLAITMGMPVKEDGATVMYVVGVYKYDTLNDVISSINIGRNGTAYMVNKMGDLTGHPDQTLVLEGESMSILCDDNLEVMQRVTSDETGSAEFKANGKVMLVAFSPIRGTQWELVIQVPKADYGSYINGALIVAILSTCVVLVFSILLVLRLASTISRPVESVTGRMVALTAGDLHTEVAQVSSGDELEVLTHTLDDTLGSLNHYIMDIEHVLTQVAEGNLVVEPQMEYRGDFVQIRDSLRTILGSMNETINGFRAASSRLAEMSEELNGQSGQLHQASVEQNQSTEELVDEVAHVKERLASVTDSSDQTRARTDEIAQCIQEANQRMDALTSAMEGIRSNAQKITQIAQSIDDIAFQTSILAINASIEAASAGSAGKGFSVVAEEVRQLAARSSEAAQSAADTVKSTREIVESGVQLTAATAGSLKDISSVSGRISGITDQLVQAVRGQEGALAIMEERIATISSIADRNLQNASGTEQASGALAREAEALRRQAERFVLKEDDAQ